MILATAFESIILPDTKKAIVYSKKSIQKDLSLFFPGIAQGISNFHLVYMPVLGQIFSSLLLLS